MLGQAGKGQVQSVKMKGWDPTKMPDGSNLAEWDKNPDPIAQGDVALGRLPSVPDNAADFPLATEGVLSEKVTWNAPTLRENQSHRGEGGGDPNAGKGNY